jgi:hypothetical protein
LLERLIEESNPIDVLTRLRGCIEIEDKGRLLSEIRSLRAGAQDTIVLYTDVLIVDDVCVMWFFMIRLVTT